MNRRHVLSALGATGFTAVAGLAVGTDDPVRYTYASSHQCTGAELTSEWRETYTKNGSTTLLENTTASSGENSGTETTADEPAIISLQNVLPGDRGTISFRLSADSLDVNQVTPTLDVVLEERAENGINEPEQDAGDNTANEGELQDYLEVRLWKDTGLLGIDALGADNVENDLGLEPNIAEGTLEEVSSAVTGETLGTLDSTSDQVSVSFRWRFVDSNSVNITQGDSVTFSFDIGCN